MSAHTFDLVSEGRDEALVEAVLDGSVSVKSITSVDDRDRAYWLLNASSVKGDKWHPNVKRLPFLGTSTKIAAGEGVGVLTRVLYMMPARSSGTNACPFASKGCEAACLAEQTGRMSMAGPQRARRRRHASFILDRERFMGHLMVEIDKHEREAKRKGMVPAIRLNGTTDILWERIEVMGATLMDHFPGVWFYDYTKVPLKGRTRGGSMPANYHLTYSLSEREGAESHAREYIAAGYSVAVVFAAKKGSLPVYSDVLGTEWSAPVIDGDKNDCRFLDTPGCIVGLSAKGRAIGDTSGFVRAPA